MDERAVKDYLMEHDASFRELASEHQEFERQLSQLTDKPFLTTDEQIQETILKKKKLVLKDKMQMLISQHQAQLSVN